MTMTVGFRVDATEQMGMGHLMRCVTLAKALQKHNHSVIFFCGQIEAAWHEWLLNEKLQIVLLTPSSQMQLSVKVPVASESRASDTEQYSNWLAVDQQEDADCLLDALENSCYLDFMVVDHYAIDHLWEVRVAASVGHVMVIDDLANRQHACDLLLDPNYGRAHSDYQEQTERKTRYLLGINYALLRDEFVRHRDNIEAKRLDCREIKHILISMGGADRQWLTTSVIKMIEALPNAETFLINAIFSQTCEQERCLREYLQGARVNVNILVAVDDMAQRMLTADIAFGAGGGTAWERIAMLLPSVVFLIADNQSVVGKAIEETSSGWVIDWREGERQDRLAQCCHHVLQDMADYQRKVSAMLSLCDGLGSQRVVAAMESIK